MSQVDQRAVTVSVIIPAYNAEQTIAETLQSVFAQTLTDFEVIVVDDGSTDETPAILKSFDDPRLQVITQVNRGISAARNVALGLSRGAYIALLDNDDCWRADKLERHVAFMRERDVQVSFTWVDVLHDGGELDEAAHIAAWFNRDYTSQAELVATLFTMGNFFCASTAMVSHDLLDVAGGFCLTAIQAQDFDLWLRLLKRTPLATLTEPLTMYRRRTEPANLTYDPENSIRIRFEVQQIYRTMFQGMSAELFTAAFPQRQHQAADPALAHMGLEQAFLFLEHHDPAIRYLGLEQLYALLKAPETVETALSQYGFSLPDFFALTRRATSAEPTQATIDDLKLNLAKRDEEVRWQDEQRHTWEKVAEEREVELTKRNEEIRWQDEQRRAWQLLAEERAETIVRYYAQQAASDQN